MYAIVKKAVCFILAAAILAGCGGGGVSPEMRLSRALEAIQQGKLDEALRLLSSIRSGGGWLRPATWTAPMALRLRAGICLKLGLREEAVKLLKEYAGKYGSLGPGAYAGSRLDFIERFRDWQGVPALIYLRGLEAEESNPALAIREWRTLLRDYPTSAIAPAAQLRLGLLQKRLGNAAWALSELSQVAKPDSTAVDPDGNLIAPQAVLGMAEVHRDLLLDKRMAVEEFRSVAARWTGTALREPVSGLEYSPGKRAEMELAEIYLGSSGAEAVGILEKLASSPGPAGLVTEEKTGNICLEARLRLADIMLGRREWARAGDLLVEVARQGQSVEFGPPSGPGRLYGFEAASRLEGRLGRASSEEAMQGLAQVAGMARSKDLWSYAQFLRVRILVRRGQKKEAEKILAEMEKRFPNVSCDPEGTGLLMLPAKEAKRLLGG